MNETSTTAEAAQRLQTVQTLVERAAREASREPGEVRLIAVSKTFDSEAIRPVLKAGQRDFGENRVQEAKGKWPELRADYDQAVLHLIGPMQSNKVRDAVALFDVIHSIDRDKIAVAVAEEMARQGRTPDLLVQVNTGGEKQKSGVLPQDADAFLARCRDELDLAISGLMCIPPIDEAPGPHFALLAEIAERNGLPRLSMGMSADFETAIELGATDIRVGTAIFGQRPKPAAA